MRLRIMALGIGYAALGLLALELAARLALSPPRQLIAYDADLGWKYVAGAASTNDLGAVTINSLGFRDLDHAVGPAPGKIRVLILGDSYTAGMAVGDSQIFARLLERMWGAELEVIVGAVSAWSTDQQLLYWRKFGRHWHPDLVLLLAAPNDLREVLGKKIFTLEGGSLREHMPRTLALKDRVHWWLLNHSWLALVVAQRFGSTDAFPILSRYFPFDFPVEGRASSDVDLYRIEPPEPYREGRALFAALLGALEREVTAEGARLALAVVPTKMEAELPKAARKYFDPNLPSEVMKQAAQAAQIPYLDLRRALPPAKEAWLALYFQTDRHFNEAGHRWMAEALLPGLKKLSQPSQKR